MEQYYAACDNNAYNKAALKKAMEYLQKNPWEWRHLCYITKGQPNAISILTHFSMTSEGNAFRKEWQEKSRRQDQIGYTVGFFVLLLPIIIGILMAVSGN